MNTKKTEAKILTEQLDVKMNESFLLQNKMPDGKETR